MKQDLLIVEDEPSLREAYIKYFRELDPKSDQPWGIDGFEVVGVGTAEEAMVQLMDPARTTRPFDLMIVDLMLPYQRGGPSMIEKGLDVGKVAQTRGAAKRTVIVSSEFENVSMGAVLKSLDLSTTHFVEKSALKRTTSKNLLSEPYHNPYLARLLRENQLIRRVPLMKNL